MPKLPSAVQKAGEEAERLAQEAGIAPGSDPKGAPAEPAAAVSGQDPVTHVTDPVQDPNENWEKRFKELRSSRDGKRDELQQQVTDLTRINTSMQAQLAELTERVNSQTSQPQPDTATTDPKNDDALYEAWLNDLPDRERMQNEYTAEFLRDQFNFAKATGQLQTSGDDGRLKSLESKMDVVLETQDKTAAELYEEALDTAYPNDAWIEMTETDGWGEFCRNRVSPIDSRFWGDIVKAGKASHDANSVIWVLRQFQKQQGSEVEPEVHPLAGQVTPDGGADGGNAAEQIDANAETFTKNQVAQFFVDVTKGKYTPEQSAQIEAQIKAAGEAGKIIEG